MTEAAIMVVAGNSHETATDSISRSHYYDGIGDHNDDELSGPYISRNAPQCRPEEHQGDRLPHRPRRQNSRGSWTEPVDNISLDATNLLEDGQPPNSAEASEDNVLIAADDILLGTTIHTSNVQNNQEITPKQELRDTCRTAAIFDTNDRPLSLPSRQASMWSKDNNKVNDDAVDACRPASKGITRSQHHHSRDTTKRVGDDVLLSNTNMQRDDKMSLQRHTVHGSSKLQSSAATQLPFSARFRAMAEFEQPLHLPKRRLSCENIRSDSLESFASLGSPTGTYNSFQSSITSFASFASFEI